MKKYKVVHPDVGIHEDEEFELLEIIECYRLTSKNYPELLVWASWTEQIEAPEDPDGPSQSQED